MSTQVSSQPSPGEAPPSVAATSSSPQLIEGAHLQSLQKPSPGEGPQPAVTRPLSEKEQLQELRERNRQLEETLSERTQFLAIMRRRRAVGYWLGGLAAVFVVILGISSIRHLDSMAQESYSKLPIAYFGTITAGHCLITIALVFFCYQLMRAAERLILPYWWAEKHPETARLVLGMTDPLSAASKLTEQIVDSASRLTGASKPQE